MRKSALIAFRVFLLILRHPFHGCVHNLHLYLIYMFTNNNNAPIKQQPNNVLPTKSCYLPFPFTLQMKGGYPLPCLVKMLHFRCHRADVWPTCVKLVWLRFLQNQDSQVVQHFNARWIVFKGWLRWEYGCQNTNI